MANSNTTLASLWVDDVQVGSPVKIMPGTPGKSAGNGTEIRQDIVRFYKDSGLEPVAKEIIVQCFFGLILTCYGVVHVAGSFREICASAELESKTWDMLGNRQAFYSFCHRGMAINYRKEEEEDDS